MKNTIRTILGLFAVFFFISIINATAQEVLYKDDKVTIEKVWGKEYPEINEIYWNQEIISEKEAEALGDDIPLKIKLDDGNVKVIYPMLLWYVHALELRDYKGTILRKTPWQNFRAYSMNDFIVTNITRNSAVVINKKGEEVQKIRIDEQDFSNDDYGLHAVNNSTCWNSDSGQFTIYKNGTRSKYVKYSDGSEGDSNLTFSKELETVMSGFSGRLKFNCWDIEGNQLWTKEYPYDGFSEGGRLLSAKGSFCLIYCSRDHRTKPYLLVLDNKGQEKNRIQMPALGLPLFYCSDDESYFGMVFFMDGKTQIVEILGKDNFKIETTEINFGKDKQNIYQDSLTIVNFNNDKKEIYLLGKSMNENYKYVFWKITK